MRSSAEGGICVSEANRIHRVMRWSGHFLFQSTLSPFKHITLLGIREFIFLLQMAFRNHVFEKAS